MDIERVNEFCEFVDAMDPTFHELGVMINELVKYAGEAYIFEFYEKKVGEINEAKCL